MAWVNMQKWQKYSLKQMLPKKENVSRVSTHDFKNLLKSFK